MVEATLGVSGSYWLGLQRPAVGKPFAWTSGGWPRYSRAQMRLAARQQLRRARLLVLRSLAGSRAASPMRAQ